ARNVRNADWSRTVRRERGSNAAFDAFAAMESKSETESSENKVEFAKDIFNLPTDSDENFVLLHSKREFDDTFTIPFQRKMILTRNFISRLGLEAELEGHSGCVNCLEWSTSGELLASGSDDCQIIIWDPFSRRKLKTIQSGHQGNIFSVKFLPNSNNGTIVSGAGDYKIRVHDVNASETTMACSCHANRVKRLATAPNLPFMFWSAAEDGLILQFDLRQPHTCSNTCKNVLVNLICLFGAHAEAKCVAINPLRPELLAVGANDPYIRLYDRRMLKPTTYKRRPDDVYASSHWERLGMDSPERGESEEDNSFQQQYPTHNLPSNCVKYFVAGHLPIKRLDFRKKFRTLACTYIAFSPQGNELLANLGGEQIYLFDIVKPRRPKAFGVPLTCLTQEHSTHSNGYHLNGTTNSSKYRLKFHPVKSKLPPNVDALRQAANDIFAKGQHTAAIELYNKAINLCPNAAVLYGNRAAIFMKRGWDGDMYCALRDCYKALEVDPDFFKAHFRLVRCLYELHKNQEAYDSFKLFKTKYPEHVKTSACVALDHDINKAISAKTNDDCGCSNSKSKAHDFMSSSGFNEVNASFSRDDSNNFENYQEKEWTSQAFDFSERFCGHCNTTTDIKEANFFGSNYIVAGSDDGTFFTWDRKTTNIVRILKGDSSIVNCLQPHPSCCLLATSGIESVVRLWSPRPEDGQREVREVTDFQDQAQSNQLRMNMNPLETMLLNMGYRIPHDMDENDSDREANILQCRQS
ncbi:WD and tetratricopeptide repeats protein 1-like protein, partial [Dinothrombium tinctorium]